MQRASSGNAEGIYNNKKLLFWLAKIWLRLLNEENQHVTNAANFCSNNRYASYLLLYAVSEPPTNETTK